jgi:hypothetical protein
MVKYATVAAVLALSFTGARGRICAENDVGGLDQTVARIPLDCTELNFRNKKRKPMQFEGVCPDPNSNSSLAAARQISSLWLCERSNKS